MGSILDPLGAEYQFDAWGEPDVLLNGPAAVLPPPTRSVPRLAIPRRGRRTMLIPAPAPDSIPIPNRSQSTRNRCFFTVRGRRTFPVPAQTPVPPAVPGNRAPRIRRTGAQPHGRQWLAPIAPPIITLIWPPPRVGASRRLLASIARGRRSAPGHVQGIPVKAAQRRAQTLTPARARALRLTPGQETPTRPARSTRILTPTRRGRQTGVVPAQVPVPKPVFANRRPAGRRYSMPQRGRQFSAAWFLVGAPAPPPPCITPPTFAVIAPYSAAAAVTRYSAAATVSAYSSTASLKAYLSSSTLLSYTATSTLTDSTSDAQIVAYTSLARIGPKFCA